MRGAGDPPVIGVVVFFASLLIPWAFQTAAAFFGQMWGAMFPLSWVCAFGLLLSYYWLQVERRGFATIAAALVVVAVAQATWMPRVLDGDGNDLVWRWGLGVALAGAVLQLVVCVVETYYAAARRAVPGS